MGIQLPYEQFQNLLAKIFNIPLRLDLYLKVEKAWKRDFAYAEAIRVYLPELNKEIDQTVERGETPKLMFKQTIRKKTGKPEVEIVFLGSITERHIEELFYAKKPPKDWISWGLIVLTFEQVETIIKVLQEMIGIRTLD
jgi:hypothetical protein